MAPEPTAACCVTRAVPIGRTGKVRGRDRLERSVEENEAGREQGESRARRCPPEDRRDDPPGDTPRSSEEREQMASDVQVLNGIRVVEMTVWVAGPSAGGIMSDWGADVIKVEPP